MPTSPPRPSDATYVDAYGPPGPGPILAGKQDKNEGFDSQLAPVNTEGDSTKDAVWGEVGDEGPNYRDLGWWVFFLRDR